MENKLILGGDNSSIFIPFIDGKKKSKEIDFRLKHNKSYQIVIPKNTYPGSRLLN